MLYGGRWNARGIRMVYTSSTVSLATLETLANLSSQGLEKLLYIAEIDFPDDLQVDTIDLPSDWNVFPYTASTVKAGTAFFRQGGLCLKVPSAIVPTEYNYLINPNHDDFKSIKVLDTRPMILDRRLIH